MNTVEVLHHLERLHPRELGEWSFHREVFGIDAYAVRLYRGDAPHYRRVAYEVKVSRSDFLNELRRPEKRRTAVALSHQYYLAMPAELAARCLPDVEAQMPDVGVLEIHEVPPRDRRATRLPFVGCGPLFCVRMLRKAPISPCRGYTAQEWTNLLRREHRPEPSSDELRRRMEMAESQAKEAQRALRSAKARESAALARVDELSAQLLRGVQLEDTVWIGEDRHGKTIRAVVDPDRHFTMRRVDLEPGEQLYHGSVWVSAGEFLEKWRRETDVRELATSGGEG